MSALIKALQNAYDEQVDTPSRRATDGAPCIFSVDHPARRKRRRLA